MQVIGIALFEFVLAAAVLLLAISNLVKAQGANVRRYISVFAGVGMAGLIVYYAIEVGEGSLGSGLVDIVLLTFANMTLAVMVVQVCLYAAPYQRWSIAVVDAGCDSRASLVLCVALVSVAEQTCGLCMHFSSGCDMSADCMI